MIRWTIIIALVIAAATFAAWFADQYLCERMPDGARLCFGTQP
jgi:hypothetical protein